MGDITFFQFSLIEIILVVLFFILFLIQLFYYSFYYSKPLSYLRTKKENEITQSMPSVSVIITTQDNSEELSRTLPAILAQDYPDYEVIVVNNGYTEEANNLIKKLKLENPHLYDTFLPYEPLEKKTDRRKLALTIGIKAAKKDILLFTEADSTPLSNKWISSMMEKMNNTKDIVIGYCAYIGKSTLKTRIAKFDNLLFSLKYLSSAIRHKPYTGTYRNVAYRKKLFFENKGFASFLNYEHPEDIFLNSLMTSDNVAVAVMEEGFMETNMERFGKWKFIKRSYYAAKKHFKNFKFSNKKFFPETCTRYLFYLLFLTLIPYGIVTKHWVIVGFTGLLFIIKLLFQLRIINKSSKYFKAGKFYFSFILMEIMQPFYNLYFKTIAKQHHSKI